MNQLKHSRLVVIVEHGCRQVSVLTSLDAIVDTLPPSYDGRARLSRIEVLVCCALRTDMTITMLFVCPSYFAG